MRDGEDGESGLRSDTRHADEHLEERELLARFEAIERLVILAHHLMRVQQDVVARRMARDEHLVADARHVDHHMACAARDDLAAYRRDHVEAAAATASMKRARCAWVSAIATASATLSCVMGVSSATSKGSIRWIACLSARPDPAIELLTSCGVYSAISRRARAAQSSATPRASDTRIAVCTFLLK